MKNKIQGFLFLLTFAVFGVAGANGGVPMLTATVYERVSDKSSAIYEKDYNPIFVGGSNLDIDTFNSYFNSEKRVIALTQGSRAILDIDNDALYLSDTKHFDIFNAVIADGQDIWLGETLNAGIVSAATEQYSVKLNYQYRYATKNAQTIEDLAKKGNKIKKVGIDTVVTLLKNKVYVVASYKAKSGNTRYIALSLTDAVK